MLSTVKILGERNTGTNFLELFLLKNFSISLAKNEGGLRKKQLEYLRRAEPRSEFRGPLREAIRDDNHFKAIARNGGWKHAAPTQQFVDSFANPKQALVICIVRHPAAWLQSMHRNPFHALAYVPPVFSDFIRAPWPCRPRDSLEHLFTQSPLHLYLRKYDSYLWLARCYRNTMVLRYEDLVIAPESIADQLSDYLERPSSDLEVPQDSARDFGKGHQNLEQYRKKALASSFELLAPDDRAYALSVLQGSALLALYPS